MSDSDTVWMNKFDHSERCDVYATAVCMAAIAGKTCVYHLSSKALQIDYEQE